MPKLDIDMFDRAPKVGDKIKVLGKVKSINEDTGEVEVSYDDVSFVKKNNKNDNKSDDSSDNTDDPTDNMDDQIMPNTQSLDDALNMAFNRTQ